MKTNPDNKIQLVDIVGSHNCVDTADGQIVNSVLHKFISEGETVTLSFRGVDRITTAFLNAAIGQLYNDFTDEQVRRGLRFDDVAPISATALVKVIERAKRFFSDPARYRAAASDILDDED